MKTDATSGINGAASTPLADQAIRSGREMLKQNTTQRKTSESISDTLETTDREGDGRQPLQNRSRRTRDEVPHRDAGGFDITG